MKIDWIECNKEFSEELAKELMSMSKHVLIEYRKKGTDNTFIGVLTAYQTANNRTIGLIDGRMYYDYFRWVEILNYCPIEI